MSNSKSSPSTGSEVSASPSSTQWNMTMAATIRKARVDPCAFARYLLMDPAGVPDPLPEIHKGLQNHLSAHRLALVELPRDHGKTTARIRPAAHRLLAGKRLTARRRPS